MEENTQNISLIIGLAIRKGRMRREWSQKQLAKFMNVVPSLVSKWEHGKAVPPGDSLFTMALELDLVPLLFPDYSLTSQQEYSPALDRLQRELEQIKNRLHKVERLVLVK